MIGALMRMGTGGVQDRTISYVPALDGLRAIAVGLVMLAHFGGRVFWGGAYGVDVFFVLSGYLITSILLRQSAAGRVSLTGFYARRAIRLIPALIVVVGLSWWPAAMVRDAGLVAKDSIMALTYTIAWPIEFRAIPGSHLGHIWSLCVEEWFYLGWPIILLLLLRWRRTIWGPLAATGAALIGMVAAARWFDSANNAFSYILSGFGIVIGCMLALILDRWKPRAWWWVAPAALLVIAAMVFLGGGRTISTTTRLAVDLSVAVLIWALVSRRDAVTAAFAWRPLVSIGKVSYELYLWHHVLWIILPQLFGTAGWWIALVASFPAAYATHYALKPLQSMLRSRAPKQVLPAPVPSLT